MLLLITKFPPDMDIYDVATLVERQLGGTVSIPSPARSILRIKRITSDDIQKLYATGITVEIIPE